MMFPRLEDYDRFLDGFVSGLEEYKDVCFYGYGSYFERKESFRPWISDFDGGLILDSEVVTDKKKIIELSELLEEASQGTNLDRNHFQFNLMDRGTNRDGRFLSYSDDYVEYIQSEGVVLTESDFVSEIGILKYKLPTLTSAAFNLRSLRNHLLLFRLNQGDQGYIVDRTISGMKKTVKFPKRLLLISDEKLIPRREAKETLEQRFTKVDWDEWERLESMLNEPVETVYHNLQYTETALELSIRSLALVEQMIKDYLDIYPEISGRELRR